MSLSSLDLHRSMRDRYMAEAQGRTAGFGVTMFVWSGLIAFYSPSSTLQILAIIAAIGGAVALTFAAAAATVYEKALAFTAKGGRVLALTGLLAIVITVWSMVCALRLHSGDDSLGGLILEPLHFVMVFVSLFAFLIGWGAAGDASDYAESD